jgi:hypothetical protein
MKGPMTHAQLLSSVSTLTTPETKEAWVECMFACFRSRSSDSENVDDATLKHCLNECRRLFVRNVEAMQKLLEFVRQEELKADGERSASSVARAMTMAEMIKEMNFSYLEMEYLFKCRRSNFTKSLMKRMNHYCEKSYLFSFEMVVTRIKHYFDMCG